MDFFGVISSHYNAFLIGAGMTAMVSAVSIAAGMVLGLWLSFGLISQNRLIRGLRSLTEAFGVGRPFWCNS